MNNLPFTKQEISNSLGISWTQTAIGQMQLLHNAGVPADEACEIVIRAVLSAAGSVQATADATHFRDFNRERVGVLLGEILAGQLVHLDVKSGAAGPSVLN